MNEISNEPVNYYQSHGFIPDIYRVLHKYDLKYILDIYIRNGMFPSKFAWKALLKKCVFARERLLRLTKFNDDHGVLINLVTQNSNYCSLWIIARSNHKLMPMCKRLMKIISHRVSRNYIVKCPNCNLLHENIVVHNICFCHTKASKRLNLWNCLISIRGHDGYIDFSLLSPDIQCDRLLQTSLPCSTQGFYNQSIAYRVSLMC